MLSSVVFRKCNGLLILAESLVVGTFCGYCMQDSKKNSRNQKLISCMLKPVSSKLLAELTVCLGITALSSGISRVLENFSMELSKGKKKNILSTIKTSHFRYCCMNSQVFPA